LFRSTSPPSLRANGSTPSPASCSSSLCSRSSTRCAR
jgi:hypothetical protein